MESLGSYRSNNVIPKHLNKVTTYLGIGHQPQILCAQFPVTGRLCKIMMSKLSYCEHKVCWCNDA